SAVEVIHLMLEGAGRQPALHLLLLLALAVQVVEPDREVAWEAAAQVGHRETALVDLDRLVADRLQRGIDHHRKWDGRLVRIAGIPFLHLHDRHPHRLTALIGCDPGTVGGALGVDQVVDQLLDRRRADLLGTELPGTLAQHGIADLNDLPNAHSRSRIGSRTPRSSATSIARSYPASACRITPVP